RPRSAAAQSAPSRKIPAREKLDDELGHYVAPRKSFSRHASYTHGLGGRPNEPSCFIILSGMSFFPFRLTCRTRPRRIFAFISAMRLRFTAETLAIGYFFPGD